MKMKCAQHNCAHRNCGHTGARTERTRIGLAREWQKWMNGSEGSEGRLSTMDRHKQASRQGSNCHKALCSGPKTQNSKCAQDFAPRAEGLGPKQAQTFGPKAPILLQIECPQGPRPKAPDLGRILLVNPLNVYF